MDVVSEGSYSKRTAGFDHVRNVPIESVDYLRVLPRQISTGSTRGTQTVGYGRTKIDGSNNRIVIEGDEGSVGIGTVPDDSGDIGFFTLDSEGKVAMKIVSGTMYVYDPETRDNTFQAGILPDGTGGAAGSNEGFEVADGF